MPPAAPTPDPRLPADFSEAVFLAWVDGELPQSEAARLGAANPALARLVREMRADMSRLQSLGEERAPAELSGRIIAVLEREALLGMEAGSGESPIPVSQVQFTREPFRLPRIGPRLAMAAGLTLLVCGGAYWTTLLVRSANSNGSRTMAAMVSPINPATGESTGAPIALAQVTVPAEVVEDVRVADAAPNVEPVAAFPAAPAAVAVAIDADRALALAREGRLLIRATSDARTLAQAESTRDASRGWRLQKQPAPDAIVAAIPSARRAAPESDPAAQPIAEASARKNLPRAIGPGAAFGPPQISESPQLDPAITRLVDLRATPEGLANFKAAFAAALNGGVEFEELDQPIHAEPTYDADTILWWTQSPAAWAEVIAVPVVVERR